MKKGSAAFTKITLHIEDIYVKCTYEGSITSGIVENVKERPLFTLKVKVEETEFLATTMIG